MYTVKDKIKAKGVKVTWLAQQLRISYSTLSSYINGSRTMPIEVETRIKQLLK